MTFIGMAVRVFAPLALLLPTVALAYVAVADGVGSGGGFAGVAASSPAPGISVLVACGG